MGTEFYGRFEEFYHAPGKSGKFCARNSKISITTLSTGLSVIATYLMFNTSTQCEKFLAIHLAIGSREAENGKTSQWLHTKSISAECLRYIQANGWAGSQNFATV